MCPSLISEKVSDRSSEVFADFILSTKNQYDYSSCNAWCKSRQFFSQLVTSFSLFIASAQFQFACGSMSPFFADEKVQRTVCCVMNRLCIPTTVIYIGIHCSSPALCICVSRCMCWNLLLSSAVGSPQLLWTLLWIYQLGWADINNSLLFNTGMAIVSLSSWHSAGNITDHALYVSISVHAVHI